jgi:hypothetical protein
MVRTFFQKLYSAVSNRSKTPWAVLEIQDIEDGGRVKIGFDFNQAFIEHVKKMGFQAETDEETVQLFFMASALRPITLAGGDEAVQPDAHPQLSSNQNTIVK